MKNKLYLGFAIVSVFFFIFGIIFFDSALEKDSKTDSHFSKVNDSGAVKQSKINVSEISGYSECENLDDEIFRTECMNNITLNLAEENKDISYCQKLDNELVSISECERNIVFSYSVYDEDISMCNDLENESFVFECRENYYYATASLKSDPKICLNIENDILKESCYNSVVFDRGNYSCSDFLGDDYKNDCELYNGLDEGNADCDQFSSDLFRNLCSYKFKN